MYKKLCRRIYIDFFFCTVDSAQTKSTLQWARRRTVWTSMTCPLAPPSTGAATVRGSLALSSRWTSPPTADISEWGSSLYTLKYFLPKSLLKSKFLSIKFDNCHIEMTKEKSVYKWNLYFKVSTGAYIHQVFEVPSGKIIEDQKIIDSITWASWTRWVSHFTQEFSSTVASRKKNCLIILDFSSNRMKFY